MALQVFDLAVAALRFHRCQIALDVFLVAGQHRVCQPGQLVGSWWAVALTALAESMRERRRRCAAPMAVGLLRAVLAAMRNAWPSRLARLAGRAAETLVAADARARRQANPLRELLGRIAVGEEHASVLLPSPLVVAVDDVAAEAVDVHRIGAPVDGVGEYEGGLDLRLV